LDEGVQPLDGISCGYRARCSFIEANRIEDPKSCALYRLHVAGVAKCYACRLIGYDSSIVPLEHVKNGAFSNPRFAEDDHVGQRMDSTLQRRDNTMSGHASTTASTGNGKLLLRFSALQKFISKERQLTQTVIEKKKESKTRSRGDNEERL
jgi:hypothetical protein